MDKLFELGINDNDLKFMLEHVPNIFDMSRKEICDKIDILKYVECTDRQIKNIIVSNPNYLDRIDNDILKLINYLKQIGFKNIDLLFDSNPYFLNYDVFEIEDYVNKRVMEGKKIEDIIDEIEDNPYIIDEE